MHLFRSVCILATATLAMVANEALQASAFPFGILPLTRYMLDAVPEGAEGPAAAEAATIQDGGPLVDPPKAVSSVIDVDVAPLAVETSAAAVDRTEEKPTSTAVVEISQESSVSSDASVASSVAVATESAAAASAESSSVIPDNIRAKTNSAERIIGLGGPLLITSVFCTLVFVL
ncbi:hypothetical protein C8Q73DRAFT_794717 [Cubamyces lactineus]|nr:hypothetical protein C8Q73DRAFT_794717 [Cubamyces lactineus]